MYVCMYVCMTRSPSAPALSVSTLMSAHNKRAACPGRQCTHAPMHPMHPMHPMQVQQHHGVSRLGICDGVSARLLSIHLMHLMHPMRPYTRTTIAHTGYWTWRLANNDSVYFAPPPAHPAHNYGGSLRTTAPGCMGCMDAHVHMLLPLLCVCVCVCVCVFVCICSPAWGCPTYRAARWYIRTLCPSPPSQSPCAAVTPPQTIRCIGWNA